MNKIPVSLDLVDICKALLTARVLVFIFYIHTYKHTLTLLLSYSRTTGILAAE